MRKWFFLASHFRYYFRRVEIYDIFYRNCYIAQGMVIIWNQYLNKLRDGLSILGITGNIEHDNKVLL